MTIHARDRILLSVLCAGAVLLIAALWAAGALSGSMTSDTSGYFLALSSNNPWGEARHPLYGLVAGWFGSSATAPGDVAVVQAILHAVAALALYAGARLGGIGGAGAMTLGIVALFSQSGLYHLRLTTPESAAISFLLLAFAGTLAISRSVVAFWLMLPMIGVTAGTAYLLRPSFLPAMIALPALWCLLALRNGISGRLLRSVFLFCAIAAPFVVQSAVRWRAAGDFNIVSFGGFQMSAMAGFMLTPEIVGRLPNEVRPTAEAMLAARQAAETAGVLARTPLNSAGERSFVSAAVGYFDIYARSYDDFLQGVIQKLRRPGESWIEFNRRLQQFSTATFIAAPIYYAAWVAGATARLFGRMLVTNATMLLALGFLLVAAFRGIVRRTGLGSPGNDLPVVSAVAAAWLASTAPLIVLITFPATRYIDTAGILIPAIPALLAIAIVAGRRRVPISTGDDS
jgi:hypothetical protein